MLIIVNYNASAWIIVFPIKLQLLVHPQGQRPLVSELGIAISPGFETFVGLQYTQVLII